MLLKIKSMNISEYIRYIFFICGRAHDTSISITMLLLLLLLYISALKLVFIYLL